MDTMLRPTQSLHSFLRLSPTRLLTVPSRIQCRPHTVSLLITRPFSLSSLFKPSNPLSGTHPPVVVARISKLENAVDMNPTDIHTQLELFRELINTQSASGRNILMSRWERMSEFVSNPTIFFSDLSSVTSQDPSSPLLRSDEAFQLYVTALVQNGLLSSVRHAVQRREHLLSTIPTKEDPAKIPDTPPPNSETTVSSLPFSPSKLLAQRILANQSILNSSTTIDASSLSSTQSQLAAAVSSGFGNTGNPIHVSIAESEFDIHLHQLVPLQDYTSSKASKGFGTDTLF